MKPKVSVIITTRNEQEVLARLLDSVKRQSYKYIEIIVVDNNSSDSTKSIAKEFTKSVYNFGPERSAQRNFGSRKAKGRYLLFLDADMQLTRNVVKMCVDFLKRNKEIGALAIKEVPIAKSFWEKVKAFERSFYNIKGDKVTDAARFFDANIFHIISGYDERITGPEDWDITDNVVERGFRVKWINEIIYHFERVPNPLKLAQKKYYYGLKAHRYFQKHKMNLLSLKTVYFFRPAFFQDPMRLIMHPILTVAMLFMLSCEQIGGGLGYLIGRVNNE